jgi:3-dehydroquinate synthetase/shikimate kinase
VSGTDQASTSGNPAPQRSPAPDLVRVLPGGAMDKHIALVGFMGAGKTTVGVEVARLLERPFVDVDDEIERVEGSIPGIFDERGEEAFRAIEEGMVVGALRQTEPSVIALGGGALGSPASREALRAHAFTVLLEVGPEEAWRRVAGSDRPLARDEDAFQRLYDQRRPVYETAADAVATDADGVLLAAGGIHVEPGALRRLASLVHGEGPLALIADERVLALHQPELGERLRSTHSVPSGEKAKTIDVCHRLWEELALDRTGFVVALGGGTTTDVAGFVAATYLRGLAGWVPVPSTLVGQVDAAIGGKTGIDLDKGKNLVGAFNPPTRVVIDPELLSTLPASERSGGMAEVVKTGLLVGRELWSTDDESMVRACAAFKAAVCLADPTEQGRRAVLNLGHTFAHGLEAAGGYQGPTHGQAVALGLRAALALSERHLGLDSDVRAGVERVLPVEPARVDVERAWQAMALDKKAREGRLRLVLLAAPGKPVFPVELPAEEVRAALATLVAA